MPSGVPVQISRPTDRNSSYLALRTSWLRRVAIATLIVALGSPSDSQARALQAGTDCRTVQDCIDAAPDGTVIKIPPGEYVESLHLVDKRVRIVGKRTKAATTVIAPAQRDEYALQVTRGRVQIRKLTFRGGSGVDVSGGELSARSVAIENSSAHGLRVDQGIVSMKGSAIEDSYAHGVRTSGSFVEMKNVVIEAPSSLGVGVYVNNQDQPGIIFPSDPGNDCSFQNVTVTGHNFGGMVIVGSHFDYTIDHSQLDYNGLFGLFLVEADNTVVKNSGANHTHHFNSGYQPTELMADGFVVKDSKDVLLSSLAPQLNERAGIFCNNTTGKIENAFSIDNRYGLALLGPEYPLYKDLGNAYLGNTNVDVLKDGDLPVPSQASPIPP
jgi:hypothetical protein